MEKYQGGNLAPTRRKQIRRWVRDVEKGLALRSDPEFAGRIHLLRYEELKADPPGRIDGLLAFAGLDHPPELVAEIAERTDISAYRTSDQGPYRKGVVGDWSNSFTPEDDALFRELAGPVFEAVGYTF
jgi:hypothetical protein